jgi:hypothetical protein
LTEAVSRNGRKPSASRYRIPAALAGVQRVFDTAPDFDPAVAEREFTLMVSDYAAAILGEPLAELAMHQAPNVRLRFVQSTPPAVDDIEDTLRAVDGLVMPHGILSDLPVTDLHEDSWCASSWRTTPWSATPSPWTTSRPSRGW